MLELEPQILAIQRVHRQHPHDTGWRSLPWAVVQTVDQGPYRCLVEDGRPITITAGEGWVLPPRLRHRIMAPQAGRRITTIWTHCRAPLAAGGDLFLDWRFPRLLQRPAARAVIAAQREILAVDRSDRSLPNRCRFIRAAYTLIEALLATGEARPDHSLLDQRVHEVMNAVRATLSQGWDRDAMARELGLSPTRLHDVFKAATGLAPMRWLRQERLDQAKERLLLSDRSIQDIASAVGFDDPYHFSRVFKQQEGVSPLHWRQQARISG